MTTITTSTGEKANNCYMLNIGDAGIVTSGPFKGDIVLRVKGGFINLNHPEQTWLTSETTEDREFNLELKSIIELKIHAII